MIKLSYSTWGLTKLDLLTAIDVIDKAGYLGVELDFHREQLNPFEITDSDIEKIKQKFASTRAKPAAIHTPTYFFCEDWPHEPSLMCVDLAGRKRRINLIKHGVWFAKKLGVEIVTLESGFIRDEHVQNSHIDPKQLLVEGIREVLTEISPEDNITLVIEPQPGMFIETVDQAIDLIEMVNSPYFKLHLDLCHHHCSEVDSWGSLEKAAPYTKYLHISDTKDGHNLKIVKSTDNINYDLDFASFLVYYPDRTDFLFLDSNNPIYFYDKLLNDSQKYEVEKVLTAANVAAPVEYKNYNDLSLGKTDFEDEIFVYKISIPGIGFNVIDRAKPILRYLRSNKNANGELYIKKMVANTLTGKVHYHEIPGKGDYDFQTCFQVLEKYGFNGYGSVELYHHVDCWQKALDESYSYLANLCQN